MSQKSLINKVSEAAREINRSRFLAMALSTACFLSLLLSVSFVDAASPITVLKIRVIDPPGRLYETNDRFILNVTTTDLNRVGGISNVRVRIFRGGAKDLIEDLGWLANDKCYIYPSKRYRVGQYNGGIEVDARFNRGWLDVSGEGKLEDGKYLLVFERRDDNDSDYIKLKPMDRKKYFSAGFPFKVKVPGGINHRFVEDVARYVNVLKEEGREDIKRIDTESGRMTLGGSTVGDTDFRTTLGHLGSAVGGERGLPCYSANLASENELFLSFIPNCCVGAAARELAERPDKETWVTLSAKRFR